MAIYQVTLFTPHIAAFIIEAIHSLDRPCEEGDLLACDIQAAMWFAFDDITAQFGSDYFGGTASNEPASGLVKRHLKAYSKEDVLAMWLTYAAAYFSQKAFDRWQKHAEQIFGLIQPVDLDNI